MRVWRIIFLCRNKRLIKWIIIVNNIYFNIFIHLIFSIYRGGYEIYKVIEFLLVLIYLNSFKWIILIFLRNYIKISIVICVMYSLKAILKCYFRWMCIIIVFLLILIRFNIINVFLRVSLFILIIKRRWWRRSVSFFKWIISWGRLRKVLGKDNLEKILYKIGYIWVKCFIWYWCYYSRVVVVILSFIRSIGE